jgi:hypothetical protein
MVPEANTAKSAKPAKKGGKSRLVIIATAGAAAVVAIALVLVLVVFKAPAPTKATAEDFLLTIDDLNGLPLVDSEATMDFTAGESPMFSLDCGSRNDFAEALAIGDDWGVIGFEQESGESTIFRFQEQIIGFDSEQEVDDVIAAVEAGSVDSDCDYFDHSEGSDIESDYKAADTLSEAGLPGNGVTLTQTLLTRIFDTTTNFVAGYSFAKRGNVLAVVTYFSSNASDPILSDSELEDLTSLALKRFNG